MFEHCKWDAQSKDQCVLADFPIFLLERDWEYLARYSEAMHRELLEVEEEVASRPEILRNLGLPRQISKALTGFQKSSADSASSRVMRFDFHWTSEGWAVSEVNSDVPGGFIEASGFAKEIAKHYPETCMPGDPARAYARAIRSSVEGSGKVGFIHATAHSDDTQVMEFLSRQFERDGMRCILASPLHLRWDSGAAILAARFATGKLDAVVRFFPAEWLPGIGSPKDWIPFFREGQTLQSNPGRAIISQSKRLPLFWSLLRSSTKVLQSLFPPARCDRDMTASKEIENWVIKPALGRVGEGVGLAGVTLPSEYERILGTARRRPDQWVAQRRFHCPSIETDEGPHFACLGVFTVGGRAAGIYGRTAPIPLIDDRAQDTAVLIMRMDSHP